MGGSSSKQEKLDAPPAKSVTENRPVETKSSQKKEEPCLLTKKALDRCIENMGSEDKCLALLQAHKKCLKDFEMDQLIAQMSK